MMRFALRNFLLPGLVQASIAKEPGTATAAAVIKPVLQKSLLEIDITIILDYSEINLAKKLFYNSDFT